MSAEVRLAGLNGVWARDFLAACGVLAAVAEPVGARGLGGARLRWEGGDLRRTPVVEGLTRGATADTVAGLIDADRQAAASGALLTHGVDDLTLTASRALGWIRAVVDAGDPVQVRWLRSLIDPDVTSTSRAGLVRRTPLHFTSGQQRWLDALRTLGQVTTREHITSLLGDPTPRLVRGLPTLRFGDPPYPAALTGKNPGAVPSKTVERQAGIEWLIGRGLTVLPPVGHPGESPATRDQFTWPTWDQPLTLADVRALLAGDVRGREAITDDPPTRWSTSRIVRQDHGYGNFAPPTPALIPVEHPVRTGTRGAPHRAERGDETEAARRG